MNTQKNFFSGLPDDAYFKERSLGELIYNCFQAKNSLSVAIVDAADNVELTYSDIVAYSLKLAQVLKNKFDIQKNDIVAIISTNSWKIIIVMLSTMFCGGTILSLNPNYSKLEIFNAFKISKPKIIFGLESVLDRISSIEDIQTVIDGETILLDQEEKDTHQITFNNLIDHDIIASDFKFEEYSPTEKVCFILNSSGTTGFPKGVMLTEEGIRQSIMYLKHPSIKPVSERTVSLALLPLFHIFGVLTTLSSMLTGTKTVIINKFAPASFLKCVEEYSINTLFVVPQILSFLTTSPLVKQFDITSLEVVVTGAAPLLKPLEEKMSKKFPNVRIQQVYGSTEVCGATTFMPYDNIKIGSVGKLIPNMQGKIIDIDTGKTLSYNETGELCLKSPGLMKGYKGNKEETENSIKDGWWHSGDVAYFDEDEYLYITGRIKELIKYKGFQVAPAQLEEIISTHPAVKDVGVIGKPDERAGELATALIVRNDKAEVTESEIIDFIKGKLSVESELHGGVIFINEIPRNPSGKILRQKLKEMLTK